MSVEIKLTRLEILDALGIAKDEGKKYYDYLHIIDEYILLIKRNEIVDKIKLLSDKNLGNFAEKLVLEIAEDTNGNVELLDKVHEILNK
tara:strand:+ start:414 stop:680 length:267 start_codon:yes stop_codon:yes gene_type:complete